MTELQDIYDNLNNSFSLDGVVRYYANQAEVYRKVVLSIRDAVPGGHEVDLDGLVALVRGFVSNAEVTSRQPTGND